VHTRFSDGRSAITLGKGTAVSENCLRRYDSAHGLFLIAWRWARPWTATLILKSCTTACPNLSDRRETALEAGQFAKSKAKGDIIELRDCAIGEARDAGVWRGGLASSGVSLPADKVTVPARINPRNDPPPLAFYLLSLMGHSQPAAWHLWWLPRGGLSFPSFYTEPTINGDR